MKRLLVIICLFVGLGCGLAACRPQPDPTSTPAPTRTPTILFEDNFDADKDVNGWNIDENVDVNEQGSVTRQDDKLTLEVKTDNTFIWSNPGVFKEASDVIIEVETQKTGGTSNNLFGVVCRYVDAENFYFFLISSDGHFGIGKVKAGQYSLFNRWDYPPSQHIKTDDHKNTIKAVCLGETLSLSVNGEALDVQQDSDFESGSIGLIVGAVKGLTAVSFDNLKVTGP